MFKKFALSLLMLSPVAMSAATEVKPLRFLVTAEHTSVYNQADETNTYVNTVIAKNDTTAPLTLDMIAAENADDVKFTVLRVFTNLETAINAQKNYYDGNAIATISLNWKDRMLVEGSTTKYKVDCTIAPIAESVQSGSFVFYADAATGEITWPEGGVRVTETITESVKENTGSDYFVYQIHFRSAIEVDADCDDEATVEVCSRGVIIPIYRNTTTISGVTQTKEAVINDTNYNGALSASTTPNFNVRIMSYPAVANYIIEAADFFSVGVNNVNHSQSYIVRRDGTTDNSVDVGKLEFNSDAKTYNASAYDFEKSTFVNTASVNVGFSTDKVSGTDIDTNEKLAATLQAIYANLDTYDSGRVASTDANTTYVTIASTPAYDTEDIAMTDGDGNQLINTYGSNIQTVKAATVEIKLNDTEIGQSGENTVKGYMATSAIKTSENSEAQSLYVANLDLSSVLSEGLSVLGDDNTDGVPNYRVWRVIGQGKSAVATLISGEQITVTNTAGDSYNYGSRTMVDGSNNTKLYLQDAFWGTELKSNANLPVTYVVRVYAQDDDNEDSFYVAEASLIINFNTSDGIHTAVDDINSAAEVASVTYYNTVGHASSTPFSGINIVVTRYTDGTASTTRVLK